MTILTARFPNKCRRCKKWVLHGERIEWERGAAAWHLTPEQCERALPSVDPLTSEPVMPMNSAEHWSLFEQVGRLLEAHPYRFAKTMPTIPHCYTRRHEWADNEAFSLVVTQIRRLGARRKWGSGWYFYLDVNNHFYWSMEPRDAPPEATTLINRAVRAAYPQQNPPESTWFPDHAAIAGSSALTTLLALHVGSLAGRDVLDIGCTWPSAATSAKRYLGIGSAGDIQGFRPGARTLCTPVARFVPVDPERFDVVAALFGAGDHLQEAELARLPLLVRPGGLVVVMFRAERWREGLFPGTVQKCGGYVLVVYRDG